MEEERWKGIDGFEGKYEISTNGRVRSIERMAKSKWGTPMPVHSRFLMQSFNSNGYKRVYLFDGSIRECKMVHILVAKAFILNIENKPCVDHINGDRSDNRVENLRWCTHKENCNFALAKENKSKALRGEKAPWYGKFGAHHVTSKAVSQYTADGSYVRTYGSIREASRETGIKPKNINRVCLGQRKTTGGYIWKYADKNE